MGISLAHLLRRHRTALFVLVPILALILYHSSQRPNTLSSSPFSSSSSSSQPWRQTSPRPVSGVGAAPWEEIDDGITDELDSAYIGHSGVAGWLGLGKGSSDRRKRLLVTGGAGSLGQALVSALDTEYTVHILDIVPRPVTLIQSPNVFYHRGSILAPSTALSTLLASTSFDGIVHLAAISLDQWCAPKYDDCLAVNQGGTEAIMKEVEGLLSRARAQGKGQKLARAFGWGKTNVAVPWVVYASTMDVFGSAELGGTIDEQSTRKPVSALGKTKLAGELVVKAAFDRALKNSIVVADAALQEEIDEDDALPVSASASGPQLRAAVVRFSDVYGYDRAVANPSSFIPQLIVNAMTSLPIQYSSDHAPIDAVHVDDAVDGLVRTIKHLDDEASHGERASFESFNLASGGKRWMTEEIVDVVRAETLSLSPVRDIGDHRTSYEAVGVAEYSFKHAQDILGWQPTVQLPVGLALTITSLAESASTYAQNFIYNHCSLPANVPSRNGSRKLLPEDERNQDLYKLDGCTVNMGFENMGWLHHVKCEDGRHCTADDDKVVSYNWNSSVFIVRRVMGDKDATRKVTVRLEEEKGMGYLGLKKADIARGGQVHFELFQHNEEEDPFLDVFELQVAPDKSYMRVLIHPDDSSILQVDALSNVTDHSTWFNLEAISPTSPTPPHYDMRMTVLCCPSEGDWPLLLDDFESADMRFGSTGSIPFNASRRLHICDRAEQSLEYYNSRTSAGRKMADLVGGRVDFAGGDSVDAVARLPTTTSPHPHAWALKNLPPCWNDCSSPTICIQTGKCRCIQADNCPRRRENPLVTLQRAARTAANAGSTSHLGVHKGFDPVLSQMVAKVDWRDVLLPQARAYIATHSEFVKLHVADGYEGQSVIESAECHKLQQTHCFSADSILYKAMRHISVPSDQADLIVLPVYQHCTGADFILHDVYHHAAETIPGVLSGEKTVAVVMTHDWGICIAFAWEIWSARQNHQLYPDPILNDILVWSVMGDYDSPCYRPAQDVVVPARTCRSYTLVETFPDVDHIRPVRERPRLLTWSGTYWGTGKSSRLRLTCDRGGAGVQELMEGQGPQSSFENWDYMNDLGTARFCPQPRGIAGWSPRVNDAIYAGCIPVLIAEGSHYPFASMLDWSQFSVRVHPTELDQIERVLAAIPLERVEQLQANLVAVREAFLYATDEAPEKELARRGPMFFALHEAGMRLRTQYPVQQTTVA